MASKKVTVPVGNVKERILLMGGGEVAIEADLAELDGVPTKRLNEQVKRNKDRFPQEFAFQLIFAFPILLDE